MIPILSSVGYSSTYLYESECAHSGGRIQVYRCRPICVFNTTSTMASITVCNSVSHVANKDIHIHTKKTGIVTGGVFPEHVHSAGYDVIINHN